MTYEEAKRILHPDTTREALAEIEFLGGFKGKEKLQEAVDEACLMACEALDKQIPKKPRETRCALMCANCGNCKWLGKRHQKCACCRRNHGMKDNYEEKTP